MKKQLSNSLSKKEIQQLENIFSRFNHENAMVLEEVDGLFAAFHCSPYMVPLKNFLCRIWGDETGEMDAPFETIEEFQNFTNLIMRYLNEVGRRFDNEIFFPNLTKEEKTGQAKGNDWAKGFLMGAQIAGGFGEIIESEESPFIPIFLLAHEHNDDLDLRSFTKPLPYEEREKLFVALAGCVTHIHRSLKSARMKEVTKVKNDTKIRNVEQKAGRNDPCPCGSNLKYKKCCLNSTFH